MKPCIMHLLVTLRMGGAERLALNISRYGRSRAQSVICGFSGEPGDLAKAAEREGFTWAALRADRLGRLKTIWALSTMLREKKVSLLHAQAGYLVPYALPAAKLAGIPLVYTEHALHSLRIKPKLRSMVRLAAPYVNGIVCVSEPIAEYFTCEMGIAPSRVRVIENGVDTEMFNPDGPRAAIPWNTEDGQPLFVFGNVARLNEAKDHGTLLHAFAAVWAKKPEARLLLVGDGEERPAIEGLIAQLGIGDAVHITGMCAEIPDRLRSMDAFVLSSKREGLPMAVLEAMASGVPLISTTVGNIPALNRGEERLSLVPPEDAEALAQTMLRLMDDLAYRATLAVRSCDFVREHYGNERMARAYWALYQELGGVQ